MDVARDNAVTLGEQEATEIRRMDALRPRKAQRAHDLVFLDPPYGSKLAAKALAALAAKGWIAADALVIVEVAAKEDFAAPAGFTPLTERVFGAARFVLLRHGGGAAP